MASEELQTGLDMCWLKHGDLWSSLRFESMTMLCVTIATIVTVFPALYRSLTSSHVVLDCFLTVLETICIQPGEILHEAPGEEIYLEFLPFSNNCSII